MFFFFSKILEFFIEPFTWAIILFALALIVRKARLKKRLFYACGLVLIIFSNPFLFTEFARWWDIKTTPPENSYPYSCAIVLGGFSGENARGEGYFNGSADRFLQAVRLYHTGRVKHILITSGNGSLTPDKFREADWVKTQLPQFKVPDSCVLIEDQSRNTIENAAFTKKKLDSAHLKGPYLLITSAFHMRRSLQIFNKTKIDVVAYPCNYLVNDGYLNPGDFVPDAGPLGGWEVYIKEMIGYLVNLLR